MIKIVFSLFYFLTSVQNVPSLAFTF